MYSGQTFDLGGETLSANVLILKYFTWRVPLQPTRRIYTAITANRLLQELCSELFFTSSICGHAGIEANVSNAKQEQMQETVKLSLYLKVPTQFHINVTFIHIDWGLKSDDSHVEVVPGIGKLSGYIRPNSFIVQTNTVKVDSLMGVP